MKETFAQVGDNYAHDASVHETMMGDGYAVPRRTAESLEEDSLRLWWRRVQQYPLLTSEREITLARRIEQGDAEAFNEMVECNLRLVANIARKCRRFAGSSLTLADLIQEGCCGLIRAVKKFDSSKGYKFSTYASYWIRQAVMRSIAEQGRSIRLPVHMVESVSRTDRARCSLTQELERPPTKEELAMHLKIDEGKVQDIIDRMAEPMSLDVKVGDDDDAALLDMVEDDNVVSPVDNATRLALREEIARAFVCLTDREVEVLRLRYGLDAAGQARTLDEVGACLHLTRERIRQIEKAALKRLKLSMPLQETEEDSGPRPATA
ncbi:MAG TPA: sigma-70 family RNA polymerase sigma factor [Abditibacteriaceae bacterium]|nr:sigma-70 family RNA polymerase sigma factor [Abditibacteriaceae bacterium]